MTLITQHFLICDGEFEGVHCRNVFGADPETSYLSPRVQIEKAKQSGWKRPFHSTKDYCPDCRKRIAFQNIGNKVHFSEGVKTQCGLLTEHRNFTSNWKDVTCENCTRSFRRQNE